MRRRALAALALLAACTSPPEGVTPVAPFDPARYEGRWFEIARLDHAFERGLTNVTATYAATPDGTLKVVNRGWDPEECDWSVAEGTARFLDGPETASLAVSFFPLAEGGYHVFALDEDYRWALVSGPSRDYLWILARAPELDPETRERLVETARAKGFPVEALIDVPHGDPECAAD